MRNLIYLFVRYGGIILFFSLEVLCMYLVVAFNQKQKEIFVNSSNKFTGAIYNMGNNATQYLNLTAISDSLAKENAKLWSNLDQSKYFDSGESGVVNDYYLKQRYEYIAARVINNSHTRKDNYLTLDKGSENGLEPGMGVISNFGVVGIINNVSKNFSTVVSVLHSQSRISGGVRRTGHFGGIVWKGKDPQIVELLDIPKHANPQLGDTIQTTGYSACFPEGIRIGLINKKPDLDPGSDFFDIEVKLSTDLSNIRYVYVVNNLARLEQLELEQEVKDE